MTQKLGLGFGFTKKARFHEKRMAKKSVLKNMEKNTYQREIRPVWNSAQRINHQNKFVPSAVLTRLRRVPVSAAKQSSHRVTTSTSTFRPVNTATYTNRVNASKLRTNAFHKSHSPIRRVNGVNTAGQTAVSIVKGNEVTAVKASAGNKDFLIDYQDIDGGLFPLVEVLEVSSNETDEDDTTDDAAGEKPIQKLASENQQTLKNVLDKMMDQEKEAKDKSNIVRKEFEAQCNRQNLLGKTTRANSTNSFNTVSSPVNAVSAPRTSNDARPSFVPLGGSFPNDPLMHDLEDTAEVQNTGIFGSAYDDDDLDTYNSPYADQVMGAEADFNYMEPSTVVSPIPSTRVHSIHLKNQIIGDPRSAVQTRGMTKKKLAKIAQALNDESWVEAMQEELLQFKI
ncbi:hypothetical protein Tco_0854062 [Tanacetum coccineum]